MWMVYMMLMASSCLLFLINTTTLAVNPEDPYHITIGNMDVWRVQDSSSRPYYTTFFPNLTLSDWTGLTDAYGRPFIDNQGQFLNTVSYSGTLVKSQNKWILVDDGLGSFGNSNQTKRLPQIIAQAGAQPQDINYVVITHFHTDHTGWNVIDLKSLALQFPNAIYLAQQAEIDYWSSSSALKNQSRFIQLIQSVMTAGRFMAINGPYAVTGEVQAVPCKGHTPGHQCVMLNSNGNLGVIVGDAMHHPVQVQKPNWSAVFDWNTAQSVPTRQNLIDNAKSDNMVVIASHFQFPGVGKVITNPFSGSGLMFMAIEEL